MKGSVERKTLLKLKGGMKSPMISTREDILLLASLSSFGFADLDFYK